MCIVWFNKCKSTHSYIATYGNHKCSCKHYILLQQDLKEQIQRMTPSTSPRVYSPPDLSPPYSPFPGEAREIHPVPIHILPVGSLPADHIHPLKLSSSFYGKESWETLLLCPNLHKLVTSTMILITLKCVCKKSIIG